MPYFLGFPLPLPFLFELYAFFAFSFSKLFNDFVSFSACVRTAAGGGVPLLLVSFVFLFLLTRKIVSSRYLMTFFAYFFDRP